MDSKTYVGPFEVLAVEILDKKTPAGNDMVRVSYVENQNPSEVMPKAIFEACVTSEPRDFNFIREARTKQLIITLTEACLEADVRFSDMAFLAKALVNKLEDAFERASSYLWTKNDKAWVPGVDYRNDRSLLEVDDVLRTIPVNEQSSTQSAPHTE